MTKREAYLVSRLADRSLSHANRSAVANELVEANDDYTVVETSHSWHLHCHGFTIVSAWKSQMQD